MTALAALEAERIKLVTTRSPLWAAIAVAVVSLGIAALQGAVASGIASVSAAVAATGVVVFGVPTLTAVASLTVTGEYRTGLINTTFLATPRRAVVLAAKAVVAAAFSSLCAVVLVVGSVVVAKLAANPVAGSALSPVGGDTWRQAGVCALYAMLAAVLGVGVGALLRAAAGAVALLLLWPLIVEPLLANLPKIGDAAGQWLPFANILRFTDVQWLYPTPDLPWGDYGSLLYFVVVVAAVFAAAAVVTERRDA